MSDNVTTFAKPAVRDAWADIAGEADLVDPGNAYVSPGWLQGATPPPRQYFNWVLWWTTAAIRYFCQVGIVDYDAAESYGAGGIARGPDGILYRSLVANNVGNTPANSPTQWGTIQVATPSAGDNSNAISTTAFVTSNFLAKTTPLSSMSGSVTAAQVPQGAVTQYQGALAIAVGQLTGTLANSQLPSSISISGSLTAGTLAATSSDRHLKDEIAPIRDALAKVRELQGVTFRFKRSGIRSLGLIAQDVRQVVPEVVVEDEATEFLGVAYGNLVAVLIEAIKELDGRVHELETR